MEYNNVISNIVVPIVSAIIGGGLTLIGVLITIRNENKKRKEEIAISNKPLFYLVDPSQGDNYKNAVYFEFSDKKEEHDGFIEIMFKNTDNAILVFDYISIDDKKYYPQNGNVVDKNTTFDIFLYPTKNTNIKNKKIIMSINDSLNNNYKYLLEYKNDNSKHIDILCEIKAK